VRGDLCLTTGASGLQLGALRIYGPYGEALATDTNDGLPDNQPGHLDYGWLGQHQRPHEHAGSLKLIQMGARPYSPLFGRFLSVDPVEGGSANDYDYTNANPTNNTDLDGQWSCRWCKRTWNRTKSAAKASANTAWRGAKWAGNRGWFAAETAGRQTWRGARYSGQKIADGARYVPRAGTRLANSRVGKFGVAIFKVNRFVFSGCYIVRALRDTDSSWRDEAHDLWQCFNPFGNYIE
jgi:RHS repeat-associated protein